MSLTTGDRLGPYVILAPIGAGGMGEVYRARDTKLDREVAIKVLPAALAQHPDRLARFEREAKVLAALNHPNIAMIHGLEDRAIVMELVEGPTLADRLRTGPIPLEESLKIAAQIADALEAAHERGIVHRDLKPANIKVRDDGTVKVLDFGLATAVQSGAGQPGDGVNSPTLTMGATEAGVILGTAAYMSPEQAAGKPVDRRADIWSFGVVLWEMLTGKRLFEGETVSHTLADVLRAPIDFDKLPKGTPGPIRELLRRCLDRDTRTRLRDIGEARITIQKWLANPAKEPEVAATAPSSSQLRARGWQVGAGVLALALVGVSWIAYRATRPAGLKPLVRLDVDLGSDVSFFSRYGTDAVISPDGTRLVYVSYSQEQGLQQARLFVRSLDQTKATELPGTEGADEPFFSPDGKWVGFFAENTLKKISVDGGAAIPLAGAGGNAHSASWGDDGNIIVSPATSSGLFVVSSAGGAQSRLTELAQGEMTQRWPQILPGAKAVLFTAHNHTYGFDEANIKVMTLPDHRTKILQRGGTFGRYLATSKNNGYLMYVNRGTLFAVAFDLQNLETRGTPVPMMDQVAYNNQSGSAQFDVSKDGTLVYRSGGETGSGGELVTVQWLDETGKMQPLLAKAAQYDRPRLSPDGNRLALGLNGDIWVYDWQRDTMTRLTFDGGNSNATWSPDGRFVVFGAAGGKISWTRSDGATRPQILVQGRVPGAANMGSFAPNGKQMAFWATGSSIKYDLWTVPVETDSSGMRAGKPEPFLQTQFDERYPAFSPDGRWIAYSSNDSGSYEIYVRAFPDNGGKWLISGGGGIMPQWSSNGRELFFETRDFHIMVATYAVKGDSFLAEKPRMWSNRRLANHGMFRTFDVAPDAKRIATLMPLESADAPQSRSHVVFLENFADELRRKVPVK